MLQRNGPVQRGSGQRATCPCAAFTENNRTIGAGDACMNSVCSLRNGGDVIYAQATVPFQVYTNGFSPDEALCHGTLFPELLRPYTAGKGGCQ